MSETQKLNYKLKRLREDLLDPQCELLLNFNKQLYY